MSESTELQDILRRGLTATGLTIDQLARRAKVHRATVFRLLSDDPSHTPSSRTVSRLLKALEEVGAERGLFLEQGGRWLLGREQEPAPLEESARQIYLAMPSSLMMMLENAIAARVKLTLREKDELFLNGVDSPELKIKLGTALGLLDEQDAQRARSLVKIRDLTLASKSVPDTSDPEFAASIRALAPKGLGDHTEADPLIVVVAIAAAVLERVGRAEDQVAWIKGEATPRAT